MKILLLNAHSPQNAGDLAILEESLRCLADAFPGGEICVSINDLGAADLPSSATYVPSFVRWLVTISPEHGWRWNKLAAPFLGTLALLVALLFRWTGRRVLFGSTDQRRLLRAYFDADVVAVIGGGHLYAPNRLNIAYVWSWVGLALALTMGKPLVLLPQSFGPLPGLFQRSLLRWALDRSALVATREFRSLQLLSELGLGRRVLLLPDLAFQAHAASRADVLDVIPDLARSDDLAGHPFVGMTLMDWGAQNRRFASQAEYEQAIITLARHVIATYHARLFLFAQCTGPTPDQDDRRILRRVAAALPSDHVVAVDMALSPALLKGAYAQLDALVATRMHSAIFGLGAGTPTLVIGYLHKSKGIMEQLGLSAYAIDIADVDALKLCALFDRVWVDRRLICTQVADRLPQMRQLLDLLPHDIAAAVTFFRSSNSAER